MDAATATWISRKEALQILGISDGGVMHKLIATKRFRTKKEGTKRLFDKSSVEEVLAERTKSSEPAEPSPPPEPNGEIARPTEEWLPGNEALALIGREGRHSVLHQAVHAGRMQRKKRDGLFVYRVIDLLVLREHLRQHKRVSAGPRSKKKVALEQVSSRKKKKSVSVEQVNAALAAEHDASLDARIADLIAYMSTRVPNLHRITIHVPEMRCEIEQRVVNSVNLARIA